MAAIAPPPELQLILVPSRMALRHRIVRPVAILCGLVLLSAAALKLYGLNVSPFAQYGWLLTPAVQSSAVAWEVLLGIWLLSGANRFLAWVATVATFAAFAGVSGYLGFIGQASCGCFGVIQASPWAAFAVDVSALVMLALARPGWTGWVDARVGLRSVCSVALLLAVLAGIGIGMFGSVDATLARLRVESLGVSPTFLDFGTGKPGDKLTTTVTVQNWTDQPVRIYGGTSDCTCIATLDLPMTIDSGGWATISVELYVPSATSGQMTRNVELFTNCSKQPTIWLKAGCRVK